MEIKFEYTHSKLIELSWPKSISPETLKQLIQVKKFLEHEYAEGIKEIRMGFHTLSLRLQLDIQKADCLELLDEINTLDFSDFEFQSDTWSIPVYYGAEFGKDLFKLSELLQLSEKEIITLHASKEYQLYFYGFLPGFMYLGGLDPKLHIPRKSNPERTVKPGSVAIGGSQTGIYPIESPGGWHVIGNCPISLFDIHQTPPVQPKIGDLIRFRSIDLQEYNDLKHLSKLGNYTWKHD
ncbi:Allophanate hydrolase 2 subunit 1 [Indibacter alkaliphilus LW1]|uniref:Allophanate hydrolase 2 subunit 1 n=1 Tax=Indibacter alkaliphilus (strain CCUG 57479 / KCTC 22604 / LW1) TaxID=1189612 RepID=S2DI74_INDAL|nr:5-oxoprolinase subunit PxpB [Indibacter alkaliphilus]EOZ98702.1 Allophanate hydrolase 2 subunit 1 [Indibacter alkaliphilus LW1]